MSSVLTACCCCCCCCSPFTDPFDGSTQQGPELTLVPEVGKPAKVDLMNVYAGKVSRLVWHGRAPGEGGGGVPASRGCEGGVGDCARG
jgi:hypothetical protein